MKFLQLIQKRFESLGLSRNLKSFNHQTLRILAASALAISSLWMFVLCEADSSQEYMESIFIINACSNILISYTSIVLITEKIFSYIDGIEEFLNERLENSTSKAFYENASQFVEKISAIGFITLKNVFGVCCILPQVIASYFKYFTTDLGNDAFHLPIPVWFPFDWRNPTGYLMTVIVLLSSIMAILHYLGCLMFLAYGAAIFGITLVKDLKNQLYSINEMASDAKFRKKMYEELSEFIGIQAKTQQMIASFSDLYDIPLTVLFISFIIDTCAALLLVQIEISQDQSNSAVLLEAAACGVLKVFLLLFVCELGQRISDTMNEIDDSIIQLDWYLFPIEVGRILPIIMQNAQNPTVVKCFGNILCARTQFKKVVKTTYSYFMLLRKFYK